MKARKLLFFLFGINIIILFSGCLAAEFAGEAVAGSEIVEGASLETIAAEEAPIISSFEEGFTIERNTIIIQDVAEVNKNLSRVFIQNNNELWIKSEKGVIKIADVLDENKINLINAGEVTLPGNLYYTKGNGINVRMGPGYNYEAFASKTIHLENGQLVLIRRVPNSNWWILPMGRNDNGRNIYGYVDSANLLPIIIKTNNLAYDNGHVEDCQINNTGDFCFTNNTSQDIHLDVSEKLQNSNWTGRPVTITIAKSETKCLYSLKVGVYDYVASAGIGSADFYPWSGKNFQLQGQIKVENCKSGTTIIK